MTELLTKDQLRRKASQRRTHVTIEGVGRLLARKLNAREVRDLAKKGERLSGEDSEDRDFAAGVLIDAVITEDGDPFFDNPAEIYEILGLDDIESAMEQILRFSGCDKDGKETEKNSDAPTIED